eukprot:TRINITY_DN12653_c0_g2_i3.p1 TRINITY_DN12653_c0_g2~~TRINITY_DN12653_c0_g2_i3.p1  ORF type:complete len:152 (-),score=68.06 TRINITY_DN12653_c0_g2_i3:189-644(-)
MVITTNSCTFSEYRIYPGRGIKFVSRDCKVHYFISRKCTQLAQRKIKPVKLNWTQAWRRYFQKTKAHQIAKKRVKRKQKIQKAIEGVTLETIEKMKQPDEKLKIRDQASKEIKERQRKLQEARRKAKANVEPKKGAAKAQVVKNVKGSKKK